LNVNEKNEYIADNFQERRRFVRVPFIFPVKYTIFGDPENKYYHALSDNLSEGGIKIISIDKIREGEDIILEFSLPTPEGIFEIRSKGKVVWYREKENRNFCGVEFSALDEGLKKILQDFINRIIQFRGI
jgi:c-di-GMP-binding flagellar brake protein YcgR